MFGWDCGLLNGLFWPISWLVSEFELRDCWVVVVGTLYATFFLEDKVCCCLICDRMLVVVIDEC